MSGAPVVLILGGSTGIGRAVAAAFARRGCELIVTGQSLSEAARTAQDLAIRHGVPTRGDRFDALEPETHQAYFAGVVAGAGDRLHGVVAAFGILGDQLAAEGDPDQAATVIAANFTGMVTILGYAANWFETRRHGFLVGISSVAGDRGRRSNYIYGSAKAGLATYLAGLRHRLHPCGVTVVTIKPGLVDTGMTWGLPGRSLAADSAAVGEQIARAVERDRAVVYVPWFWRWIMLAIRLLPEALFQRTRL